MTALRDPWRIVVAGALLALAGATAFGLWHVVVGGLIHGNARAGAFGLALALVAGTTLFLVLRVVRRRPRG